MENKLIYIIEDDKDIRDNLSEFLESEGFHIATAVNGEEALKRLQLGSLKPGLILLDLMMPVMNGQSFIKLIKEIPDLRTIPIVVISAGRDEVIGEIAGLMRKPLDLDEIIQMAEKFCGGSNV